MPFNPTDWGGRHTSKNYELMMMGATPISKPISLFGSHAVTGPNQNLSDATVRRFTELINGNVYDREEVIRPAQELSITMTMFFGDALETAIKERARIPGCKTTAYSKRICPEEKYGHAYIWEDMLLNPPSRVNDVVTIGDTALAEWQSEFRITKELYIKEVGAFRQKAPDAAAPLYAVAFFTADCVLCGDRRYVDAIAVGGVGGVADAIVVLLTGSKFGSSAAPGGTVPAPVGSIGSSVWTSGNKVLVGFADEIKTSYSATGPTIGGTMFSVDAGENFTLDANITAPIMDVTFFNGRYFACGGADGANPAYFAESDDGITWTSIPTTAVGNDQFTDMAVDKVNGKIYLTTATGKLYMAQENGDAFVFTLLATPSGVPATALWTVEVFDDGRVGVGGKTASTNYYAETFDEGATWIQPSVSGSAEIVALTGVRHHQVASNGSVVKSRSILTDNEYAVVPLQNGVTITGNYTGGASAPDGYLTQMLFVTDDGEVVSVRDFSPYY